MTMAAQAVQDKAIEIGKLAVRATTFAGGHPTTGAIPGALFGGADVPRDAMEPSACSVPGCGVTGRA